MGATGLWLPSVPVTPEILRIQAARLGHKFNDWGLGRRDHATL